MAVIFTETWQGSTSDYNAAPNWDTSNVPDAVNEAALFDSVGVTTVQVSSSIATSSWNFGAAAQSYVISGSPVTLNAGISNLANAGQLISISNNVGGSGGITQDGDSTLLLSGADAYSGATTVNAGTLRVDGSITNSATTVNSGGTLAGNGTMGSVDVASGGTLSPGASAGLLTTGDLHLESGAQFNVELGGTTAGAGGYDQLKVNGEVYLSGATAGAATLNLSLIGGFNPASGDTFVIIDNDGSDDVEGTFAGLANGDTFTVGGTTFQINYFGGTSDGGSSAAAGASAAPPGPPATGNDVVLVAINVAPVNHAPTIANVIPDQSSAEDTAWSFAFASNTFSDPDGDALIYTATLGNGNSLPVWLNFTAATRTFSGTPPQDFNGSLDLKVTASDGALSTSDTFALDVTAVNDAPTVANAIPDQLSAEDTAWSFAFASNTFSDPDGDALIYTATLGNGNSLPVWLNFTAATRTFSGTPPQDFNGSLDLKVTASDGALSASDTFALNVAAVNDAPVNTVPGSQTVDANTNTAITGFSIGDVDAGVGAMATALGVAHGTLTVASAGGAAVSGSGTGTVVLTGTLAAINTTLAAAGNVIYHGASGFSGADALTVTTNDGGNTGSGGAQSDTDQVAINVNPPPPPPTIPHLVGTPGDDSFTALPGSELIDGLGGNDTVTFNFRLVDATVTYSGNKVIIDGPSSHTVLTGFETYVFLDGTVNNNDGSPLIDDLFYYSRYHDVWNAHVDADAHYNLYGWHEWRDPSAFFSTAFYLAVYQDVKASGQNPLTQFDQAGWKEGRIPSPAFDPGQYRSHYPDVAAANVDPLAHFLSNGAQEGRQPFAPTGLIAANGFDYIYYLQHSPDVLAAHVDPFVHFETTGWKEGRNPNAFFDTNGYLATYVDVKNAGVNPLDHYHLYGWSEGRDPSIPFDTADYLSHYPDVAAAHIDPLLHFLANGIHEGRLAFNDGAWG
jgi:autotransporter-associated beta strand protein